jgi:hypothetical protein
MSFDNIRKTCKAHVISTTSSGMAWSMDWGSSKKAQLQTTISIEIDVVDYSSKWMGAIYF